MKNSLFTLEMNEKGNKSNPAFSIIKLYGSSNMIGKAHLCPRIVNLPGYDIEQAIPAQVVSGIMKVYESSNMLGRAHMCPRVENIPDDNIIEMIRRERSQMVPELTGAVA